MVTWNETVEEIFAFEDEYNNTINIINEKCKLMMAELENKYGDAAQVIRLKYIRALEKHTGRNVITYYSGWLQKHDPYTEIEDNDVSGFVDAIHDLDTNIGLDIIIHTPGGDDNVVEAIVNNLRATFGNDIRAIIPQLAMSSGTLLVLACDRIMMGKHSSIGPIDPQYIYSNGDAIAAQDVIDAYKEAQPNDKVNVPLLRLTFEKYEPAFIKRCENDIKRGEELAKSWLRSGMFKNLSDDEAKTKIDIIVEQLNDRRINKSHSKHIDRKTCINYGLNIECLEDDKELEHIVMSIHHAYIYTFDKLNTIKIIENRNGECMAYDDDDDIKKDDEE